MTLGSASGLEAFGDHILKDEEILWYGRPDPSVLFASGDLFLIPFTLMWGGFALAWEALVLAALLRGDERAANGGSLWFMAVFGVIFVATGLYLIFGRHIFKRIWKKRTHYAVTNRRVIALTRLLAENARAEFIDRIPAMKKAVRPDGKGTIWFGSTPWWVTMYGNTGLEFLASFWGQSPIAFYDIPSVNETYQLVNELRHRQREQR